jgi:hypothetical protein
MGKFLFKTLGGLMVIKTVFAAFILMLGSTFNANAALLQMNFNGSISSAGSFEDPTGLFAIGDSLSGFWLVETTTADTNADTSRGIYPHAGTPSFQINIGTSTFQTNTSNIQILDNFVAGIGTLDAYDVLANGETSNIAGLINLNMQITFRDTQVPFDVFSDDSLPSFAPNLADFDQVNQAQAQLSGLFGDSIFFMNLEIDSVSIDSVSAVPVPAAVWLFGTALIGLVGFSKRRKTA